MNIEEKIRNNREAFDDVKMPEGSRERFEAKLANRYVNGYEFPRYARNDSRIWLTFTTAAAAAITALVMIFGINQYGKISTKSPQVSDSKIVTMRQFYDEKVEEAIINLEDVMENVDDTTRMQINAVIHDLMNMGDVFAEMAPLPEDRQMAIAEQIYDNNLRTLELLTDKLNK